MKEIQVTKKIEGHQLKDGLKFIEADPSMIELASWVSQMTVESKTMLPKSIEEVLAMFAQGRSVVITDSEGAPIAHAAITFLYEEAHVLEIGGAIVEPNLRRKGYGLLAAMAVSELADEKFPGWTKMVLCNSASLPLFLKLGAIPVDSDNLSRIPEAAWEACLTCPNYGETKTQGKICCDTPVIMP